MLENEFHTPENLPKEFLLYEQKVKQLGVGETGKTGEIKIVLQRDPETNKTVVKDLFSKVPLQVQKILYVEYSLPQMAYVYMMSPSGGILQGDRLKIDIRLENNAHAHVTTQAATKVYRMNRNYATQIVNVFVDNGCYLELVPDQLIPYRNSRFYQRVQMQVHDNATAIYSEIITPGRVTSNEHFQYDVCYLKTIAMDQNSRMRFVDTLLLDPKKQKLFDGIGFESRSVFANMYILTRSIPANSLSDDIHDILNKNSINGSASVLPRNDGVFARMIADNAAEIKHSIDIILNKVRNGILNKPFTGARKY
jgi:urease accessory protein